MATADSVAMEMRDAVITAGGSRSWDDTREAWLVRAARALGIGPSRAKSLFYQKARLIPAHEADNIRLRIAQLRAQSEALGARHEELAATISQRLAENRTSRPGAFGLADFHGVKAGAVAQVDE